MEKIKFEYYSSNVYDTIPKGEVELYQLLESIRNPKDNIKQAFKDIQRCAEIGDLKQKDKLKATKLFYTTPSVKTDKQGRKIENIVSYNPIMVVEFDKIDFAEELKQYIFTNFKCVVAGFLSPSKKGCKFIVRIQKPTDLQDYKAYYCGICYVLSRIKGFDGANFNVLLPLYNSWDEQILIRPWDEVEEWTRRGGKINSFKQVNLEDFEPLEEVTEEDIKKIHYIIDSVFEKIEREQTAHKHIVGISTYIGGIVGAGYIDYDYATDYICNKILESDYCSKGSNGYCKTAREMVMRGMSSPIKLEE